MLHYEKEKKSSSVSLDVVLSEEGGSEAHYEERDAGARRLLSGTLVSADSARSADPAFVRDFCNKYYTVVLTSCVQKVVGFQTPTWLDAPGYLTVKTDTKGVAKVSGKLPDGQAVSGSAALLPTKEDSAQLYLFVAPTAYKKAGFYGTVLGISADGSVFAERGDWKTPPAVPEIPGVSEADPPGFLSMAADGRLYGSVASLENYCLTLQTDAKTGLELEYSYKDSEKQTQYEYASAVDLGGLIGSLSLIGKSNGSIAVPTSKKIWKNSEGYYDYWDSKPDKYGNTEPILNPAEATISFAKATGVFSGKFKVYFDYETLKYGKYGDELYVPQHKAVSVPYAGVVLNDMDMDENGNFTPSWGQASGQYAQTLTLQWEDDKGKTKTKTYKKTTAIGVNLTF